MGDVNTLNEKDDEFYIKQDIKDEENKKDEKAQTVAKKTKVQFRINEHTDDRESQSKERKRLIK